MQALKFVLWGLLLLFSLLTLLFFYLKPDDPIRGAVLGSSVIRLRYFRIEKYFRNRTTAAMIAHNIYYVKLLI